jgi:hypothetical protein
MEEEGIHQINSDEQQEEKKKIPSIYKILLITALSVLLTGAVLSYMVPKSNEYPLSINSNIHDVDFIKLVEDLKDITKPDDGKLYSINRAFNLIVDKEGDLENLSLDFIVLNNGKPVHYQTRINKTKQMELVVSKSYEMKLDEESFDDRSDIGTAIALMERLPWGHLKSNIDTEDYSLLGISNFMTGDGRGNIRVDVGQNQTRAFEVVQDGSITEFMETTVVPESNYYVLSFVPSVAAVDDSNIFGKLEVQYFFRVN